MSRRPPVALWQLEKQRTAKGLRELPKCEYTEGCEGRAMGFLAKLDPFRLLLACPKCALAVQRASRADAPRES